MRYKYGLLSYYLVINRKILNFVQKLWICCLETLSKQITLFFFYLLSHKCIPLFQFKHFWNVPINAPVALNPNLLLHPLRRLHLRNASYIVVTMFIPLRNHQPVLGTFVGIIVRFETSQCFTLMVSATIIKQNKVIETVLYMKLRELYLRWDGRLLYDWKPNEERN